MVPSYEHLIDENKNLKNELENLKNERFDAMFRESIERYYQSIDKSLDAMAVLQASKYLKVNQAYVKMLGFDSSSDLEDKSILMHVAPESLNLVHTRILKGQVGEYIPARFTFIAQKNDGNPIEIEATSLELHFGDLKITQLVVYDISSQRKAVKQIKESHHSIERNLNFLNTLIDTIPNPVYYKNLDGIFIGCNKSFVEYFGVGKEKLLGRSIESIPPIVLANIYHDADNALINSKKNEVYEGKMRNADGQVTDVIFNKSVFYNPDQTVGGMVCVIVDITRHKQAKKALKESDVRVKLALEASNLGLWDLNLLRHEIFLSPEYYTILGYAPNEFKPKIEEWLTSFYDETNQVTRLIDGDFTSIKKRIDGHEYKVRAKNGEYKWVLLKGKIVERQAGQNEFRITGTIRDISERKRAEEALKESEERYKLITESSTDAIVVISSDLHITYWNKAAVKIFGYNSADVLFKPLTGTIWPESKILMLKNALSGRDFSRIIEMDLLNSEQKAIPTELRLSVIQIKNEQNLVATIQDLSSRKKNEAEKKRLENQLQHVQKMESLGTLAGGIAHDFNNILTPIMGYTQMAMADIDPDNPAYEDLGHVMKGAERARDLVKQILSFSRQLEQEKVDVHLHLIIREVLKLLEATLPATIRIDEQIKTKEAIVYAAPTQLHQVIMNICTNAFQSMQHDGGKLEVLLDLVTFRRDEELPKSGLKTGKFAKMAISDSGIGMDTVVMERIFEPFFTTKEVGEGTGLGLSVAHGIVTALGGEITVYSEVGVGTTFTIFLPVAKKHDETRLMPDLDSTSGSESILFVDDEKEVAAMGKKLLQRMGYSVTTAADGNEALQIFTKNPTAFDLLITDQTMPGITGDKLVEKIRGIVPAMKVIMITGYSNTMTAEKSKELNINAFEMKPLVIENLGKVIRQVLDGVL